MSITRVGLSEAKNFAEGYDAIFGKKKAGGNKKATAAAKGTARKAAAKKKVGAKPTRKTGRKK